MKNKLQISIAYILVFSLVFITGLPFTGVTSVSAQSGQVTAAGDTDGNGVINILDLIIIKSCILSSSDQSSDSLDLNGDGAVDTADYLLLKQLLFGEISALPEKPPADPEAEFLDELLALVNEERAKLGRAPLHFTDEMNRCAATRAAETAVSFSHVRPDGRRWDTVFTDNGLSLGSRAENIAAGSSTPEGVFSQWRYSEGHYINMVNPDYKIIGMAFVKVDDAYRYYWVQLFK